MCKTYEEMVQEQIAELSEKLDEGQNLFHRPLVKGALWCLPFAEKPAKPLPGNTFVLQLVSKSILSILPIPVSVRAIDIEREIVTSKKGAETLVERIYFVRRTIFGKIRDFVTINIVYKEEGENLTIISQCDWRFAVQGSLSSIPDLSLRKLLGAPMPIVVSYVH